MLYEVITHAVADNPNGFPEGSWVPNMCITYEITKAGSDKKVKKNVREGVAHVRSTFNNTVVTITDLSGNTISWSNAGVITSYSIHYTKLYEWATGPTSRGPT